MYEGLLYIHTYLTKLGGAPFVVTFQEQDIETHTSHVHRSSRCITQTIKLI